MAKETEFSRVEWGRIRAVAEAALEEPPDARDAFIDGACGADTVLAREVRRLVGSCEAAAAASDFLAAPAPGLTAEALEERSLTLLQHALPPHYTLEREIGRGAAAAVYRAYDRRHERAVAIKFLLPGVSAFLRSDRFLREIRLTAQLTHPHILPLHDSGEA